MLTCIAVFLTGLWLVLFSQGPVNSTLTLVFGLVVAVLALIDLVRGHINIP